MNYLQIIPTMNCNYSCSYCIAKDWVNPENLLAADFWTCHYTEQLNLAANGLDQPLGPQCNNCPTKHIYKPGEKVQDSIHQCQYLERVTRYHNSMSLADIAFFMDQYIDPKKWVVEVSGGEITTHPEGAAIVEWIGTRYDGIVRSNGSIVLPKTKLVRVISWHTNRPMPPIESIDIITLITPPVDPDCANKERICKELNILCLVQNADINGLLPKGTLTSVKSMDLYKHHHSDRCCYSPAIGHFEHCLMVMDCGKIVPCPKRDTYKWVDIWSKDIQVNKLWSSSGGYCIAIYHCELCTPHLQPKIMADFYKMCAKRSRKLTQRISLDSSGSHE